MDKTELLEKFFKYVVITIILGIVICSIAYLYNAQKMDISFIKDVYSILFSIFAPLFAIFLFADWKEQKQYELEKQYADELLKLIGLIHMELVDTYNTYKSFDDLKYLNEEYIILNELMGKIDYKISENLFKISEKFNTIQYLLKTKIPEDIHYNFESKALLFASATSEINYAYKKYYDNLDEKFKKDKNNKFTSKTKTGLSKLEIDLLKTYNKKILVRMNDSPNEDYKFYKSSYEDYKDSFEMTYDTFMKELVKIIKL